MGRTKEEVEHLKWQITELWNLGFTRHEISYCLQLNQQNTISYIYKLRLRRPKDYIKPVHSHAAKMRQEVGALYEKGLSRKQIAAELGLTLSAVDQHMKWYHRNDKQKSKTGENTQL